MTRRTWVISQRLHDELGELLEEGHSPERLLADIHVSLEAWRLGGVSGGVIRRERQKEQGRT